ncbi:hypothetical protein LCGC14_2129280 [marine sediment metagenome]|uniref:Nuclease associated modular domain-containing protein n=1 Tax=marine sediment metagenome TaxID=412755 RepID=A0A0F9GEY9_9ZZZZ
MRFKKGQEPWNKGKKGIMKPNQTSFKRGNPPPKHKTGCKCFRCSGISWNKGKKLHYKVWNEGLTKETDERLAILGKKHGDTIRGRKLSKAHKKKISESKKGMYYRKK